MKSAEGQRHLSTIADAFYAAYSEKDCLSLELCIDFLQDIASDLKDQKLREALMQIIKQLFCVADFADGKRIERESFYRAAIHSKLYKTSRFCNLHLFRGF